MIFSPASLAMIELLRHEPEPVHETEPPHVSAVLRVGRLVRHPEHLSERPRLRRYRHRAGLPHQQSRRHRRALLRRDDRRPVLRLGARRIAPPPLRRRGAPARVHAHGARAHHLLAPGLQRRLHVDAGTGQQHRFRAHGQSRRAVPARARVGHRRLDRRGAVHHLRPRRPRGERGSDRPADEDGCRLFRAARGTDRLPTCPADDERARRCDTVGPRDGCTGSRSYASDASSGTCPAAADPVRRDTTLDGPLSLTYFPI